MVQFAAEKFFVFRVLTISRCTQGCLNEYSIITKGILKKKQSLEENTFFTNVDKYLDNFTPVNKWNDVSCEIRLTHVLQRSFLPRFLRCFMHSIFFKITNFFICQKNNSPPFWRIRLGEDRVVIRRHSTNQTPELSIITFVIILSLIYIHWIYVPFSWFGLRCGFVWLRGKIAAVDVVGITIKGKTKRGNISASDITSLYNKVRQFNSWRTFSRSQTHKFSKIKASKCMAANSPKFAW